MRLHGTTSAIDYTYLNVLDMLDPDNSTPPPTQEPMPNYKFTWSKKNNHPPFTLNSPNRNSYDKPYSSSCWTSPALGTSYKNSKNGSSSSTNYNKEHNSQSDNSKKCPSQVQTPNPASDYYKQFKEPEFDENGKLKYFFN